MNDVSVQALKHLGQEINARKYETQYSHWVFEHPEEVNARHASVDSEWIKLKEESEEKKRVLDDHLAREEVRERYRITNQQHLDRYEQLCAWIAQKDKYLHTYAEIHSTADCTVELSIFAAYEQENKTTQDTQVVELGNLGNDIRSASHKSKYSSYEFDHTITLEPQFEANDPAARQAVSDREKATQDKFADLATLAAEYKKVLDDHKAREEYAAKARIVALTHTEKFTQLEAWIAASEMYLNAREHIHSVAEAKTALTLLSNYHSEKERMTAVRIVDFNNIGADVLSRKYATTLSDYTYGIFYLVLLFHCKTDHTATKFPVYDKDMPENKAAVETHLKFVADKWLELDKHEARKRVVLQDHLGNLRIIK